MMLVAGSEAANPDDATRLVLDMVEHVLDPVENDVPIRKTCKDINYLNSNSINIKYERWSNNDCTGTQSGNISAYTTSETDFQTHDGMCRTTTKYKHRKMNFWDQYTHNAGHGEYHTANANYTNMGGNRNMYYPNQQLSQHQYANNKFVARSSWRDNTTNNPSNHSVSQLAQGQYYHHSQPHLRTEKNYYLYKKNMRKCCSFCRKNGESVEYYTSHSLYENGKPSCPILRQCICNICGERGHTMSHCSLNPSKNSIIKMIQRFNAMK